MDSIVKGINIFKEKTFIDDKKFIAKMCSGLLENLGEEEVKRNLKETLPKSTFEKFPEQLTTENISNTILSLSKEELNLK